MRSHVYSKSNTCTEGRYVNAAGISAKVVRLTQGDLNVCRERLLVSRGIKKSVEKSAEGIVDGVTSREDQGDLHNRKGRMVSQPLKART